MAYRRILSVVNDQTGSTVAARYAISLAASGGAELVLFAAHGEGSDGLRVERIERNLTQLFRLAFERGIAVTRITESGAIGQLLPRRAEEERADLVFYPLTPPESYGAPFRQQTVQRLLRLVRADLAIVRVTHMGRLHPHHILVPLGGRIRHSERLGDFLALLAGSFRSSVTLFHRAAPGRKGMHPGVQRLRDDLRGRELRVLERVSGGRIARAITLEAISHHHDLIVLGASERSSLRRLFLGTPAGEVMRHPPCNTILFRPFPSRP